MRKFLPGALVLLVGVTAANAQPAITIDEVYPVRGQQVTVFVTDAGEPVAGALVEVLYRPNSQTSFTEMLQPADEAGVTSWTPRDAGLANLSLMGPEGPETSTSVSIRFPRFEARGWIIMIFAGVFLFGGAALGMATLMREGKLPEQEPKVM
jgi:hypothetical protein